MQRRVQPADDHGEAAKAGGRVDPQPGDPQGVAWGGRVGPVVEQEGRLVAGVGQGLLGPLVPVAVGVGEGVRLVTEGVAQQPMGLGDLGHRLAVVAVGQARMGHRVVADRDPGRLEQRQLGPAQLRRARRRAVGGLAQLGDDLQPLGVGHPLEPPDHRLRGQPGVPFRLAALAQQLLGLGPPERLVAVEHPGDDEGHGREAPLPEQGQAGLEQAAVAVVEGQQHGPGRQRAAAVHGHQHVVHGHRPHRPGQVGELVAEAGRVVDAVVGEHREPPDRLQHERHLHRRPAQEELKRSPDRHVPPPAGPRRHRR